MEFALTFPGKSLALTFRMCLLIQHLHTSGCKYDVSDIGHCLQLERALPLLPTQRILYKKGKPPVLGSDAEEAVEVRSLSVAAREGLIRPDEKPNNW